MAQLHYCWNHVITYVFANCATIHLLRRNVQFVKAGYLEQKRFFLLVRIIDYLTSSYKNIVIGKWSTKSIIRKDDSVLTSLTKRVAQNLSFYKFLQRLQYKCKIRENSLRIQDEWYTSKTCSMCGCKNENLGGSKIFNCNKCKITMDRDYNGARNIMLKSLSS